MTATTIRIAGIPLSVLDSGEGEPIIVLHDELGLDLQAPFLTRLAEGRRVIAPALPGFGPANLPAWVNSADDLAYLVLEIADRLDLARFDVLACSFGGWVAAEMAAMVPERVRRMILCAPYGVKVGRSDRLDIPDLFVMSASEVAARSWHDPARGAIDASAMTDEELAALVRCRETFALLAWEPYLHNPKLPHRLHRVDAPTLFVRGASDGIVSCDYLAGYAGLLPNGTREEIAGAGHYPHREQPDAFVARARGFLDA
jgi:pimeloyl-ACP methyl ester carboxylesterase